MPAVDYGLLHASDAHRVLLLDPVVDAGSAAMAPGREPLLADPFGVAQAVALLPSEDTGLRLPLPSWLLVEGEADWRLGMGWARTRCSAPRSR